MMMLDNPSLLLTRSFSPGEVNDLTDHQHILVVNPTADQYCQQLAKDFPDKQFMAFGYNFASHQSLNSQPSNPANLTSICAAQLTAEAINHVQFDCVVIYFPKSKPEFAYSINNLFNHVKIDTPVYLVGDNKGGIKSCEKLLQPFCGKANKIDAAKHCALYQTHLVQASKPFVMADWFKSYPLSIKNVDLTIYSLPGVFSFGAMDAGTRLLLDNIEPTTNKTNETPQSILDFGCGAGIIGAFVAKLNEKLNDKVTVTGLDVNALAIESTLKTYKENDINGSAIISNGLSEVKATYHQVYSNPPFHSGVKTNYAITELFLNTITNYIYVKGSLTLVANSFLKYQPLLDVQFKSYTIAASDRRFNVYHASNDKKASRV